MRTLFIAVVWLVFAPAASACDVCGCSIGGNYFGILPQFHRHFVGLRWSEQSFQSAHSRSAALHGDFDSQKRFRSLDVLARFYPSRRFQVLTLLPYHDFRRLENGVLTHGQGLGDASVLGNFILLDTGRPDSLGRRPKWQHALTIGGGIKLPTGQHSLVDSEGKLLHENLQPGSGSTDFMLSAAYTLRRGAWGASADVLGRFNTTNRHDYRFGNRVSGAVRFFYWKNLRRVAFLPNVGAFMDHAARNRAGKEWAEGTGGSVALATMGLEVYARRFSVGFTFQEPVWQALGGEKVHAASRWVATANYLF
jgi:hypothetical protein